MSPGHSPCAYPVVIGPCLKRHVTLRCGGCLWGVRTYCPALVTGQSQEGSLNTLMMTHHLHREAARKNLPSKEHSPMIHHPYLISFFSLASKFSPQNFSGAIRGTSCSVHPQWRRSFPCLPCSKIGGVKKLSSHEIPRPPPSSYRFSLPLLRPPVSSYAGAFRAHRQRCFLPDRPKPHECARPAHAVLGGWPSIPPRMPHALPANVLVVPPCQCLAQSIVGSCVGVGVGVGVWVCLYAGVGCWWQSALRIRRHLRCQIKCGAPRIRGQQRTGPGAFARGGRERLALCVSRVCGRAGAGLFTAGVVLCRGCHKLSE